MACAVHCALVYAPPPPEIAALVDEIRLPRQSATEAPRAGH